MMVDAQPQAAGAVLMVRPTHFGGNPQTVATNELQSALHISDAETAAACREFDGVAEALQRAGIDVALFDPPSGVWAPDAVFPNNWISTHADGTVVLYPMLAPNRRLERQPGLIAALSKEFGFQIHRTIDLSPLEQAGEFVEGTGSLVLDHAHRIAYAALSPRTTLRGVQRACEVLEYQACTFAATHASGSAVYHTNVMLSVGTELAIGCFESIRDADERRNLIERLEAAGKRLLALTGGQMLRFAANVLELRAPAGAILAISANAWASLDRAQRAIIENHAAPCIAAVDTIERVGGGGIRCMLAEIHLPKLQP